jgi:hypothetical protein
MRTLSIIILAAIFACCAFAGPVEIPGMLQGPAIPFHYALVGADLFFNGTKAYIEVRGEGDCHTEMEQQCSWYGNPPQQHCIWVPHQVCYPARALFAMPSSIVLSGRDVLWVDGSQSVKIGHVKSFLFWKWIVLENNAQLSVDRNRASVVVLQKAIGVRADRRDLFDGLYPQGSSVRLMVRFKGLTNHQARRALENGGYDGPIAPTNDWSKRDVTSDEIGIVANVRQAAHLIGALRAGGSVVSIRPID